MKSIIVFYSLKGHTKNVCERLAQQLGSELLELRSVKSYPTSGPGKYVIGGKDAMMGVHPELEPYSFSAQDYDFIILAAPCWASKPASPLTTFLNDNDLGGTRRAAIITYLAATAKNKYRKRMGQECGITSDDAVLGLSEAEIVNTNVCDEALSNFCTQII